MFDDKFFEDVFSGFENTIKSFEKQATEFQKRMEDRMKEVFDMPTMFGTPHNYKTETGEDANTTWKHETWTDKSGMFKYSRKTVHAKTSDKVTKEEEVKKPTVDELKAKMEEYAKSHEYEKAAKLRDIIKEMESQKK